MSDSPTSIFLNFEDTKLFISNPSFHNFVIIFILLVISLVFARRKATGFMDITQGNELKGLAMLMVVTGHLWVHVSQDRASLILGGTAVSLFLLLSGYGLTLSVENKPLTLKGFIFRRLSRVMIPYWIITGIILLLDYLILNKTYSLQGITTTLAGINIDRTIRDLDYVRWFITLLLIEYIVFFVANRFLPRFEAILSIFLFNVLLMLLKHFDFFLLGSFHNIIAFPLGCLLAYYIKDVSRFVFEKGNHTKLIILFISCLILVWLLLSFFGEDKNFLIKMTRIGLTNLQPLLSCVLAILLVGGVGRLGYVSGFLSFTGIIALEIYLVHGPLLIKYNPVIGLFPPGYIVISFLIFLVLLFALSYGLNVLFKPFLTPQKIHAKNSDSKIFLK